MAGAGCARPPPGVPTMGCWGQTLPPGLPGSRPEQLKIPPLCLYRAQELVQPPSAMQTRSKLNQPRAREKSVNPCWGRGDVSPHGHRHPHGSEGHTGAGKHPQGLQPHRGQGVMLGTGIGVRVPMAGLSRRPPAVPGSPGSQPSVRGVLKAGGSRRETRSGLRWRPGDGASLRPPRLPRRWDPATPLLSAAGPGCDGGTQSKPQPQPRQLAAGHSRGCARGTSHHRGVTAASWHRQSQAGGLRHGSAPPGNPARATGSAASRWGWGRAGHQTAEPPPADTLKPGQRAQRAPPGSRGLPRHGGAGPKT